MLLDIHSHYAAPIAGESIWNVEPAVFSPIEGNYYSVGSCRKGSEGCQKGKKQEEELRSALDDFYEEELNWWDREHEEGEEL